MLISISRLPAKQQGYIRRVGNNAYFSYVLKIGPMKLKNNLPLQLFVFCLGLPQLLIAQITSGVYQHSEIKEDKTLEHEVKIADGYLIHSVYETNPPVFVRTLGGFYTVAQDSLKLKLEFNSNYEKDGITEISLPYSTDDVKLTLNGMALEAIPTLKQDLDGQWLFATRGPDTGQERRGDSNERKTLKFLLDGRFQWVAYHTGTFNFSGTGGGTFTAKDGKYVENIRYFSRDNDRVGAQLEFDYEVQGNDWHHKGKNSKGQPMYEIWSRRDK
jgi:hypothetical protein